MEENKKFFIENKKVWVAGSTGMVGKSIIKLLKRRKCKLIISDRKDLDLTDQRKVKNWMSKIFKINFYHPSRMLCLLIDWSISYNLIETCHCRGVFMAK